MISHRILSFGKGGKKEEPTGPGSFFYAVNIGR
jgi:hypothetical protein